MRKEFIISIQRPGEKGAATASKLLLPAAWDELTDALDQARIYDERQIYSVTVLKAKRNFLTKYIPNYVNLYELNYLAERLVGLEEWESHAFDALVRMDEIKLEDSPVPMERLINMTYSTGNCHHVSGITNDIELGEFVLANGFREDLAELSEDSIKLMDREAIGREHLEATGGVITAAGYFESSDGDINNLYQRKDLPMSEKPGYIFRLQIGNTDLPKETSREGGIKLKLPADPLVLVTVLKTLHNPEWERCICQRFESIIPGLKNMPVDLNELGQLNELASSIRRIEEGGQIPKYKALISSVESPGLQTALQLAKELDEFTFYQDMAGSVDYANHILAERHDIRPGDSWYPYIDQYSYGCSVMEKDHVKQTAYGFIWRTDGGPILSNEGGSDPVMELQL